MVIASDRFVDLLAHVLPPNAFHLAHLKTNHKKCRKLVFTTRSDPLLDVCTTHYFVLSHEELDLLALELFVFESPNYCTLFVSKADTSGHATVKIKTMLVVQQIIRGMLRYYMPAEKPVRLCLFAKAEPQYLFLGSAKNPGKHVLSDAELVKWWARCLDGLRSEFRTVAKCSLQIPGLRPAEVKTYLPSKPDFSWTTGDIFWIESPEENVPAIKCIPRFPDDPKTRFLEVLVSEKRAKKVTRQQFWLELQSRQEFRLGTTVGIFGIEGTIDNIELIDGFHSITQRELKLLKAMTHEGNYATAESALSSSRRFSAKVPENAKIEITGTMQPIAPGKRPADEGVAVNVLSTSLVRKKKAKH